MINVFSHYHRYISATRLSAPPHNEFMDLIGLQSHFSKIIKLDIQHADTCWMSFLCKLHCRRTDKPSKHIDQLTVNK